MPRERHKFVSLFSGCGGLDLGFVGAGFRCVGAFELDSDALTTHKRNLGARTYQVDLSNGHLPLDLRADVVIAGPPCQGFSTAGKRDLNDPRNSLLVAAAQLALQAKPSVFILENVAGATAGEHRIFWRRAETVLKNAGYQVATIRCRAASLGLAQLRTRIVLVAWNTGKLCQLQMPVLEPRNLGDVLQSTNAAKNHNPKHLDPASMLGKVAARIEPGQKLCNVRLGKSAVHTWDIPEVFGEVTGKERELLTALAQIRRRERIRDYGDADPVCASSLNKFLQRDSSPLLESLILKGYVRKIGRRFDLTHTFNGKFRRLKWDEPAFTVDTRFGDPRYFLHPEEARGFTVREAARVQGFPEDFEFFGSEKQQYRMIGNAVPPPMAASIANAVREAVLT